MWPGSWYDATGFGRNTASGYTLGYHEGADLNLAGNADKGKPVYPIAPGVVVYAQLGPGTWGHLILIEHSNADGLPLLTRYAHGTKPLVKAEQAVDEWTVLFNISNAEGAFPDHLHFSIAYDTGLKNQPWFWPGWNIEWVEGNFFEPKGWLSREHEVEGDDMPDNMTITAANGLPLLDELPFPASTVVVAEERHAIGAANYRRVLVGDKWGYMLESDPNGTYLTLPAPVLTMYGNAQNGANIRSQPTTTASILGTLAYGALVKVQDTGVAANNYHWVKLTERDGYLAREVLRANP
jgi:hypothetical protein